jgi:hypothetical protein
MWPSLLSFLSRLLGEFVPISDGLEIGIELEFFKSKKNENDFFITSGDDDIRSSEMLLVVKSVNSSGTGESPSFFGITFDFRDFRCSRLTAEGFVIKSSLKKQDLAARITLWQ